MNLPRKLRTLLRRIDKIVSRGCMHSGFLSSCYFTFFNSSFRREQQAVMHGMCAFREAATSPCGSSSLLRRNIHRLEKGLLMRPRREVFALSFIEETVTCFMTAEKKSAAGEGIVDEEMKWARDVLTEYFAVTGTHSLIDRLRSEFADVPKAPDDGLAFIPYERDLRQPSPVAIEQLEALAQRRRSVRWFLPKPVPRDLIQRAAMLAGQAPSACNRQPFEFRVYDDPELVPKVAALPGGTMGFAQNFPCVIVVLGRLRNYFDERDRHLIYIDASLAVMGFVYAAECLGLGTCCINWPDVPDREEQARALIDLAPDERPVMFVAVGYPDPEGKVAYSKKKPVDQLCRFNVI